MPSVQKVHKSGDMIELGGTELLHVCLRLSAGVAVFLTQWYKSFSQVFDEQAQKLAKMCPKVKKDSTKVETTSTGHPGGVRWNESCGGCDMRSDRNGAAKVCLKRTFATETEH